MIYILGIIDILAAVLLVFMGINGEAPVLSAIIISAVLLFKGFSSSFDVGGFIDIFAAVMIALGLFSNPPVLILIIAAALIGQKGLASVFKLP